VAHRVSPFRGCRKTLRSDGVLAVVRGRSRFGGEVGYQRVSYANEPVDLNPDDWHEPIVAKSWPDNPGPIPSFGPVSSGQSRCDDCHAKQSSSNAGRLPKVWYSTSNGPARMDDFCDVILDNALDTSNGTMPPFGLSPSDYKEHRQWIQDLCEAPPGDGIVTPDPPPEELNIVSSPEVVKPIWKCTNRAAVKSGLPGADVTLHVEDSNGNKKFTGTKTVPPVGRVLFKLSSDFQEGDRVWATQTYNGLTSPNSKEVVVRDYFAENPNGPEPPEVWSPIHECSKSVAVDAINGVDEITVYRNGNFAFSMKWKADLTWASGLAAFSQGERVHAKQSICGKDSSASYGVTVDYAPSPLSKVELNPKANYGGQKVVDLDGITEGASMEIGLDGSGTFAQEGSYPFDWRNNYPVADRLGRELQTGDELRTRNCPKRTCGPSSTGSRSTEKWTPRNSNKEGSVIRSGATGAR